jgi:hypothetical protein
VITSPQSHSFGLQTILLTLCLTGAAQAQVIPGLPSLASLADGTAAMDGDQTTGQTQTNPTPATGPPTTSVPDASAPASGTNITPGAPAAQGQQSTPPAMSQEDRAAQQVKQQEHQRILGVVPNFNTSYIQDAAPLSRKQKLGLAFKSATDVGNILVAAADAAYNEWTDQFPEYGEGMKGYGKYLGASYADAFDGTMLGNAIFPILLKQDPRFFRKGTGSFHSRLFYAIGTTFWCRNDSGSRGPNYSNLLGNLAAGGISNLYYPASDRGLSLTLERGFVVTAEGAIGGVFEEFWPDIAHKVFKDRMTNLQPNVPPPPTTPPPPPITPPPTSPNP